MFKNYMEDMVVKELNAIIENIDGVCDCERCKEDIFAWVLNRLKPKYVVTELGNVYTKLNQLEAQTKADVTVLLLQAANIIKTNPRHIVVKKNNLKRF